MNKWMYSHNFPWKWCLKVIPQLHLLHLYFSYLSFSYLSSVLAGGQGVPCVNSVTWLMWSVKQRCGALLCKISIIVLKKQNYLCNTSDWIIMVTLWHTLPRPGLFASDAKIDSREFLIIGQLYSGFSPCARPPMKISLRVRDLDQLFGIEDRMKFAW